MTTTMTVMVMMITSNSSWNFEVLVVVAGGKMEKPGRKNPRNKNKNRPTTQSIHNMDVEAETEQHWWDVSHPCCPTFHTYL